MKQKREKTLRKILANLLLSVFIVMIAGCGQQFHNKEAFVSTVQSIEGIRQKNDKINNSAAKIKSISENTEVQAESGNIMNLCDDIDGLAVVAIRDGKNNQAAIKDLKEENTLLKKRLNRYNRKIYTSLIVISVIAVAGGVGLFFLGRAKVAVTTIASALVLAGVTFVFQKYEWLIMAGGGIFLLCMVGYLCFIAYQSIKANVDVVTLVEKLKSKLPQIDKEEIFGVTKRGFATENESPATRKIVAEIKQQIKSKAEA